MARDPIVEDIHRIRQELLEEFGGMDGYLAHLEESQTETNERVVRREPKKPLRTRRVS